MGVEVGTCYVLLVSYKTLDRAMFLTALMGANQDNKKSWTILSYQLLANLLKEINNYKFIKIVLNGNYWVFYLGSKKLNQSVRCYFYGSYQHVVEPWPVSEVTNYDRANYFPS